MKKITFALLFLSLLASPLVYAAPDRVGKADVGINVSGAFPSDSESSGGAQVTGSMSYGVNSWAALGFSVGWVGTSIDSATSSGITIEEADVSGIPIFGEIIIRVPNNSPVVPYGVFGLGTVIWDVDDTTATGGFNIETDVDSALAVKLGGGIDWFINENWIANLEAAYVFSNPDGDVTVSGGGASVTVPGEDLDFDYWTVGGGLKFVF